MRKIEGSWAVYFDKAPELDHPVIKYLNTITPYSYSGTTSGVYYGVAKSGNTLCTMYKKFYTKIITEQEFLKLTTQMKKEEIENYKDFKKGGVLIGKNKRFIHVLEALEGILFVSELRDIPEKTNFTDVYPYTSENLYRHGWRLYVPEEKPVLELTLEDIAKKFDIPVEQLKIKK